MRVRSNLNRRLIEVYPDGSALVQIRSRKKTRLGREIMGPVHRGRQAPMTTVRLCTSLLDWRQYPATQLLDLYARRWEQELFYEELKVDMRPTLRLQSHTPLTAMQETAAFDPGLYPTASAKGTRRSSPGRGRAQRLLSSTLPTTGGYVHGLVAGTVTWSGIAQVVAAKLANTATITR